MQRCCCARSLWIVRKIEKCNWLWRDGADDNGGKKVAFSKRKREIEIKRKKKVGKRIEKRKRIETVSE